MSSDSSNSQRENRLPASLPPKRPKLRWYSPINACLSTPRLDTTIRPRRLIDEERRPPLNVRKLGAAGNIGIGARPRLKLIPRLPTNPDPPVVIELSSSPSSPFSYPSQSSSLSVSPPSFRGFASRRKSKGGCVINQRQRGMFSDAALRESVINGALESLDGRLTSLEMLFDQFNLKPKCPCLDCDCCFYGKDMTHGSTSKMKGKKLFRSIGSPELKRRSFSPLLGRFTVEEIRLNAAFLMWYNSPGASNGSVIHVPNHEIIGVNKEWMHGVFGMNEWLEDEHMDSIMICIALEIKGVADEWLENWTFVETKCWEALIGDVNHMVDDLVNPYTRGEVPCYVGTPWRNVDTIYGAGNLDNNHWILYAISLRNLTITVYDSAYSPESWATIVQHFNTFTMHLGRILVQVAGFSHFVIPPQFELIRCATAPQQVFEHDCGIMVLDYFRQLVSGRRVEDVVAARSQDRRLKYCGMLHKFGTGS